MPSRSVERNVTDWHGGLACHAYVACSDSRIEGEARGCCGMERCERGLEAALLGEAGGAAVQSEVGMVGAEGVGGEEERLDGGGREGRERGGSGGRGRFLWGA